MYKVAHRQDAYRRRSCSCLNSQSQIEEYDHVTGTKGKRNKKSAQTEGHYESCY